MNEKERRSRRSKLSTTINNDEEYDKVKYELKNN